MKTRKIRLVLPLLFPFAWLLGCSTAIRGVVRDRPTGNPISAATVSIGKASALTNAVGAYELTDADVEPSSVLLINAPGYFLYSASLAKRGDEGRDLVRDVELAPRSEMAPRK